MEQNKTKDASLSFRIWLTVKYIVFVFYAIFKALLQVVWRHFAIWVGIVFLMLEMYGGTIVMFTLAIYFAIDDVKLAIKEQTKFLKEDDIQVSLGGDINTKGEK